MVWFVNQVAARFKDEFPNKYVGTLAYQYTRKPPVEDLHFQIQNAIIRPWTIGE